MQIDEKPQNRTHSNHSPTYIQSRFQFIRWTFTKPDHLITIYISEKNMKIRSSKEVRATELPYVLEFGSWYQKNPLPSSFWWFRRTQRRRWRWNWGDGGDDERSRAENSFGLVTNFPPIFGEREKGVNGIIRKFAQLNVFSLNPCKTIYTRPESITIKIDPSGLQPD